MYRRRPSFTDEVLIPLGYLVFLLLILAVAVKWDNERVTKEEYEYAKEVATQYPKLSEWHELNMGENIRWGITHIDTLECDLYYRGIADKTYVLVMPRLLNDDETLYFPIEPQITTCNIQGYIFYLKQENAKTYVKLTPTERVDFLYTRALETINEYESKQLGYSIDNE
jgi:hypothetical protein